MTAFEIASILGLFVGPIAGALIAFRLQDRAIIRARRLEDFRILMRNRRTTVSPEFVGAFNLIEIDFNGEKTVIDAYKRLFDSFCNSPSRQGAEEYRSGDSDEVRLQKDNAYGQRCLEERQRLLTKLLFAMGRALGYKIEQLEILEGGYRPNLHATIESQQEVLRNYLIALATGQQALAVKLMDQ